MRVREVDVLAVEEEAPRPSRRGARAPARARARRRRRRHSGVHGAPYSAGSRTISSVQGARGSTRWRKSACAYVDRGAAGGGARTRARRPVEDPRRGGARRRALLQQPTTSRAEIVLRSCASGFRKRTYGAPPARQPMLHPPRSRGSRPAAGQSRAASRAARRCRPSRRCRRRSLERRPHRRAA